MKPNMTSFSICCSSIRQDYCSREAREHDAKCEADDSLYPGAVQFHLLCYIHCITAMELAGIPMCLGELGQQSTPGNVYFTAFQHFNGRYPPCTLLWNNWGTHSLGFTKGMSKPRQLNENVSLKIKGCTSHACRGKVYVEATMEIDFSGIVLIKCGIIAMVNS